MGTSRNIDGVYIQGHAGFVHRVERSADGGFKLWNTRNVGEGRGRRAAMDTAVSVQGLPTICFVHVAPGDTGSEDPAWAILYRCCLAPPVGWRHADDVCEQCLGELLEKETGRYGIARSQPLHERFIECELVHF